MMRYIGSFTSLIALAGAAGCGTPWWENVKKDPSAFVTTFEQGVHTFLQTAEVIFRAILPLLGDKAPGAEAQYRQAVLKVTRNLAALNGGLQAAQDAHTKQPDLRAHMNAVIDATADVEQALGALRPKTGGPTAAVSDADFDELKTQRARVAYYR